MRLGVHLVNFDFPGGASAVGSALARVGGADAPMLEGLGKHVIPALERL